jgi:FkbM family methyltransferase
MWGRTLSTAASHPTYRCSTPASVMSPASSHREKELLALQLTGGPNELYLPYAVGDGSSRGLKVCCATGMASLLEPDPTMLGLFPALQSCGEVIERSPVETRGLDDIDEIEHLDFLKIDIEGSELSVFQNGQEKLAEAVAIQTEVSFITFASAAISALRCRPANRQTCTHLGGARCVTQLPSKTAMWATRFSAFPHSTDNGVMVEAST